MNVFFNLKDQRRFLPLFTTLFSSLAIGCGSAIIPADSPGLNGPEARDLVRASFEAHGGEAWETVRDISVRYEGEWLSIVNRLQPVLSDSGYRSASEERLLLREGVIAQSHTGPEGSKYVLRTRGQISVWYDGERVADPDVLAAAALVADAYEMFLTGPRFFLQRDAMLERLGTMRIDGRSYDAVLATLRPGFGLSDEDRAIVYLDPDSKVFSRVRFTLNGLASTRGAEVDVAFSAHRRIDGVLWPTQFYERVESPVSLPAHRWTLEGIDSNRDFSLSALAGPAFSGLAAGPARAVQDGVADSGAGAR